MNTWGQFGQPKYVDEVLFKGKVTSGCVTTFLHHSQVKNGFFIEAGADDFETDSNTLLFELKHQWSGILVEPNPTIYPKGSVGVLIFCSVL